MPDSTLIISSLTSFLSIQVVGQDSVAVSATSADGVANTIRIIQAIGEQWKFLLVVATIAFVVAYRKGIGNLLSRTRAIEVVGQKFEFKEETVIPDKKAIPPRVITDPEQNVEHGQVKTKIVESKPPEDDRSLILQALNRDDLNEAENIFHRMQQSATSIVERQKMQIEFYHSKFIYGDSSSLSELEGYVSQIEDKDVLSAYHYTLGLAYFQGQTHEKAIACFEKISDSNDVRVVVHLWKSYYRNTDKQKAKDYLLDRSDKFDSSYKAAVFANMGDYFEMEGDSLRRALAYEKAIEHQPNNTTYLFNAAYAYANSNFNLLAWSHYSRSLFFKDDAATRNNLGVALSAMRLKFEAVKSFNGAFGQGSTIAASNLANYMLQVGFKDEAQRFIDSALTAKDIDKNVWVSKEQLESGVEKEKEQLKEMKSSASVYHQYLRKAVRSILANETSPLQPGSTTATLQDGTVVDLNRGDVQVTVKWMVGSVTHSIDFGTENTAGTAQYKTRPEMYSFEDYKDFQGFFHFEDDLFIDLLFFKDQEFRRFKIKIAQESDDQLEASISI